MVFAVLATAAAAAPKGVPLTEAISGVFGSISMAAWMCLMLPQLYANYKAQSADGISMTFLIVWMAGDVTNLLGALFTHLAPTAIAIACYFCVADCVLIAQCAYYNALNARRAARQRHSDHAGPAGEDSPLLGRRRRSVSLPGSQRRHSTHTESSLEPLRKIVAAEDETVDSRPWLHNTLSILAVYVIGFVGWFVSYKAGAFKASDPAPPTDPSESKSTLEVVGLVLGWASAVLYLFARIPQIIKNYREKSCEGLAILFFLLSLTGNFTYGVSLVAYSQDKKYLLNTIPWLIGSLGTIFEDSIIFVQFHLYSNNARVATAAV